MHHVIYVYLEIHSEDMVSFVSLLASTAGRKVRLEATATIKIYSFVAGPTLLDLVCTNLNMHMTLLAHRHNTLCHHSPRINIAMCVSTAHAKNTCIVCVSCSVYSKVIQAHKVHT